MKSKLRLTGLSVVLVFTLWAFSIYGNIEASAYQNEFEGSITAESSGQDDNADYSDSERETDFISYPSKSQEIAQIIKEYKFMYDEQRPIRPDVLLVDYYETGTRKFFEPSLGVFLEIANPIYILTPDKAEEIEAVSEGRTPNNVIVRYTFAEGSTLYELADFFIDDPQVRKIIPEYTDLDSVSMLILLRSQDGLPVKEFSVNAGLNISEECWEWITDHCTVTPPYSISRPYIDYQLLITSYEPIDSKTYLDNPYIYGIGESEHKNFDGSYFWTYLVDIEDSLNFYEAASLFFGEGNNIVAIDVSYVRDPNVVEPE